MSSGEKLPKARTVSIIIRELAGETLAYDLDRHRAYCLNGLAGRIWRRCDGQTTLAQAQRAIAAEIGQPVGEEVMLYGLRKLRQARLLEQSDGNVLLLSALADRFSEGVPEKSGATMSRRDLVRKLGLGAALLIPVVTMVIAPTAVSAASCRAKGQPCGAGLPACCGGLSCSSPAGIGVCF